MDHFVQIVALISAIVQVIIGLTTLVIMLLTHKKVSTVEINTNSMLSKITNERNIATTRADTAEAHAAGRIEGEALRKAE